MDAQAFADINEVLRRLHDRLATARYGDGRGGMVRPVEVAGVVQDVRDALATLDMVQSKELKA